MTICIYDGRYLATDSLVTCNGISLGKKLKIVKLNDGSFLAFSGAFSDSKKLITHLNKSIERKDEDRSLFQKIIYRYLLKEERFNFSAIRVYKDLSHEEYYSDFIGNDYELPLFIGSGSDVAMGAFELCKDVFKSIEVACKFDTSCNLPIYYVDFHDEIPHIKEYKENC
jgi:ATP-dependent protease HslVU (ClpYQ) peptidase subunit